VPEPVKSSAIAVSIRGMTKRFGEVAALDAATLDIEQGEFFSLLGPSGCGKTTLLRIIGGFETPTAGELLIGGRDVLDDPPHRRRTNMIFQHGALFPHLSVARNVAFGLEMKRLPKAEIARKVEEALVLVRLAGYGDRGVEQLSGGQRQRVALARALVNEPEVLLLDEPLSALDLQLRLQMQEELRRIHRATGSTFIFVTHDQGEAITMSDRLAVMSGGRILQVGTPREVYEKPARRFVAEFIGHSNLIEARIGEDGTSADIPGGSSIAIQAPAELSPGQQVLVSLRYERVEVVDAADGILTGVLEDEVYMGPTLRRAVRLDAGLSVISAGSNTGAVQRFALGERVGLRWSSNAVLVLPD
jgi:spermidine/putrescine ABC transporter ATP-binding subunit